MNLSNIGESKAIQNGLIITFMILWLTVAVVSTLHAITFFSITNPLILAIFLGVAFEIGQASVLFSILMTKNREKLLPWALMILLTSLQITANVYSSFKYLSTSGSEDWVFWQRSILLGVQATSPEMYQIIIAWISGALLPIIALGMTALVAQNIRMMANQNEQQKDTKVNEDVKNFNEFYSQPHDIGLQKKGRPKLKKVKEPSVLEKMKVPKKILNSLKKPNKIKRIKSLDEVIKPSKGEEAIKLVNALEEKENNESSLQNYLDLTNDDMHKLDPYLQGGVEVIDAKAIPK